MIRLGWSRSAADGRATRRPLPATRLPVARCPLPVGAGFEFSFSDPQVERVTSRIRQPELRGTAVVGRNSLQYYWMARQDEGPVTDVRIVSIQTAETYFGLFE